MTKKDAIIATAKAWLVILIFIGLLFTTCMFPDIMVPCWIVVITSFLVYVTYRFNLEN